MKDRWIRKLPSSDSKFACPGCGYFISSASPSLDHHLQPCLGCKRRSFHWSADRVNVQVCLDLAPIEVRSFLEWAHASLEEVQFVGLVEYIELIFVGDSV